MWKQCTMLGLAAALTACATTSSRQSPQPEFARRAAPSAGVSEIELLAGISGRLIIDEDSSCLGLAAAKGDASFVTIVWPSNAELEWASGRWQARNTATGELVQVGSKLRGSGGYAGTLSGDALRSFNRYLTRTLSPACAGKGVFTLNRDFGPA